MCDRGASINSTSFTEIYRVSFPSHLIDLSRLKWYSLLSDNVKMSYGTYINNERQTSFLNSSISPPSEVKRHVDYEWTEQLDGFSTYHASQSKDDPMAIIWDIFEAPVLLILVGISSAVMSFCTNAIVNYGSSFRWTLISAPDDYSSLGLYCLWGASFSLLACLLSQLICKAASGSGLPEMKTILSGVIKPVLLSCNLIAAKLIGLSLALIAGLSIGKEGPFVQVSGALADQLMKLGIFRHIKAQDSKRLEIIACACASGVSATFGTAFGGVLFSIEFTSSAYLVRTLPRAFLSSVCAMLVIFSLGCADQLALFSEQIVSKKVEPAWCELLVFILIGLLCALLGVIFVSLVETVSNFRNRLLDHNKLSS
jgi:H+/Cl- antiporter ClcA